MPDYYDNTRALRGWRWALFIGFGGLYLARRLIGGRWELWWDGSYKAFLWVPVTGPSGGVVCSACLLGERDRTGRNRRPRLSSAILQSGAA